MENNKIKNDDRSQSSASHNKYGKHNNISSRQEQRSDNLNNASNQEGNGNKYLSNGYLDDKERYDDSEL